MPLMERRMSYLDDILSSAQGGQLIGNLAERFGLTPEQVESAVKALAPALEMGVERATEEPSMFEKLLGALASPDYESAYDAPDAAHADDNLDRSRALLSDLFGSPAAAGQVVQVAARETGLRPDILSQLLPILASVLLGGLFKNVNGQGLGGILGQLINSGAIGSVLEQVLSGGRAAPPPQAPTPAPTQQGGGPLGGIIGAILGSLLGGGRRPSGPPMGGAQNSPIDAGSGVPEGLDQASVQQAIEQIKNQLQVGRGGSATASGGGSDLEQLIGQMFGKR